MLYTPFGIQGFNSSLFGMACSHTGNLKKNVWSINIYDIYYYTCQAQGKHGHLGRGTAWLLVFVSLAQDHLDVIIFSNMKIYKFSVFFLPIDVFKVFQRCLLIVKYHFSRSLSRRFQIVVWIF